MFKKKLAIVCPFHKEKIGSLVVDLKERKFHCFGCGKHGTLEDLNKELPKHRQIALDV